MSRFGTTSSSRQVVNPARQHASSNSFLAVHLTLCVLIGATGCSVGQSGAQDPEVNTSTTIEAPSSPTGAADDASGDYTDQFIDSVRVYKEMGVEEFESLPREERLKYAQFLVDQTVERGNYASVYGSNTKGEPYAIDPTDLDRTSDGHDIVNNNVFCLQVSYLQFIEADYENKSFDANDGQKLLSSVYYNVGSGVRIPQGYFSAKEFMSTLEKPVMLPESVESALQTTELKDGVDLQGNRVQYRDIAYTGSEDGETRVLRFVYCEFQDYAGKTKATWLLETMASDQEGLGRDSTIR